MSHYSDSHYVIDAWVDYNNHMQDAYYNVVFSDDINYVMDVIGMDSTYRAVTCNTLYTVETHNFYLAELKLGEAFIIERHVIGVAAKKLRIWQAMIREKDGKKVAVQETLLLHVSQQDSAPKTCVFDNDIMNNISVLHDASLAHDTEYFTPISRAISI